MIHIVKVMIIFGLQKQIWTLRQKQSHRFKKRVAQDSQTVVQITNKEVKAVKEGKNSREERKEGGEESKWRKKVKPKDFFLDSQGYDF